MTIFVDLSGTGLTVAGEPFTRRPANRNFLGEMVARTRLTETAAFFAGGEEDYFADLEGKPAPQSAYRPSASSVAPRTKGWMPQRSNTQTPPLTGVVRYSAVALSQAKMQVA